MYLLALAIIALLAVWFVYNKSKNEDQCPKCGKENSKELILRLDEKSNYILPKAPGNNSTVLNRFKCQSCGNVWEEIIEENNSNFSG